MSSIRDRLEQLKAKAKKPIKGDSELLRKIHPYLLRAGETEFTDPEEFVRKTKGSFSQMVDQKNGRVFSTKFYLPLEIVLNTSMAYLLEGRGEPAPLTNDRGLRYTAMTDTFGNYEKLVEEGVYLEQDEYQWTLLDYMLEFNAKNGLEFFSQRDELPLDDLGLWKGDYSTLNMYQHDQTDLLDAVLGLCEVNTAIKYLNGYHFVEAPLNHQDLSEEALVDVFHNVQFAMRREEVRRALCDYKIVPLKTANPHLLSAGGQPLGKTAFTNIFLPMMLQWAISGPFQVIEENGQIELFDKAFEINEAVMPIILSLPYSHYRVGDYGYVYSDGIVCGSIACVQLDFNPLGVFGDELAGKIARLNAQVQAFYERLNRSNQVSFLGREMQLAKVGSPVFYEFYRLMNKAGCSFVPRYEEEKSEYKDFFFLPEGKQIPLPANDQPTLYPQALRASPLRISPFTVSTSRLSKSPSCFRLMNPSTSSE